MTFETAFFENYILKPEQCVLISCLPQSLEDYRLHQQSSRHEFIRECTTSWPKYQYEISDILNSILPKIQHAGASILSRATLENFESVFNKDVKLLMLIAHHNNNLVEFYDGLYDFETIASKIPHDTCLIFDLCVCSPLPFVELLDARFLKSIVRFTNTKSSITYWIYYYYLLVSYLKETNTDFFSAFKAVNNIFHELKMSSND